MLSWIESKRKYNMQSFYSYYKQQLLCESNAAFIAALTSKCSNLDFKSAKFDQHINN